MKDSGFVSIEEGLHSDQRILSLIGRTGRNELQKAALLVKWIADCRG